MVCSLTLFFLAAYATDVRSASRRIATICSSLNRLLRIGSSLSKEPFFQKLTDRKTGPGQVTSENRPASEQARERRRAFGAGEEWVAERTAQVVSAA